jgi:hypothetical protein
MRQHRVPLGMPAHVDDPRTVRDAVGAWSPPGCIRKEVDPGFRSLCEQVRAQRRPESCRPALIDQDRARPAIAQRLDQRGGPDARQRQGLVSTVKPTPVPSSPI